MGGFAFSIDVNPDTLHEWKKHHVKFSESYKKALALQEKLLLQHGLRGKYNVAMAIFALKNLSGWSDRIEQKVDTNVTLEKLVGDSFDED
jgi:hypothetical protein